MLQNRRQRKAFRLGFGCPARYGEAELQNLVSNGEPTPIVVDNACGDVIEIHTRMHGVWKSSLR